MYIVFLIIVIAICVYIYQSVVRDKTASLNQLDEEISQKKLDYDKLENEISEKKLDYNKLEIEINSQSEKLDFINNQIKANSENIDEHLAKYKTTKENELALYFDLKEEELKKNYANLENALTQNLKEKEESANLKKEKIEQEISKISEELDSIKAKYDSINKQKLEEELREKEKEKYTLSLSTKELEDIQELFLISKRLNNPIILYKFIWSEYILSNFNKMILNQFGKNIPKNIIYVIEYDNKKYVGKTKQDAKTRWTAHLKKALGIDANPQKIHEIIKAHLNEVRFYVLEEVPETIDLGTREHYYIELYDTVNYGYNMRG